MDGNKDDALIHLKIGKEALDAGNRSRALKFFTKARRIDPTLPVDDLLSATAERESDDRTTPDSSPPRPFDQPSIRQRNRSTQSAASLPPSSPTAAAASYTEEQIKIAKQIKEKKDYYEILAPGAEEAYKAVTKAFQCLSNEESRQKYDIVGSEEPVYEKRASAYGESNGFNGFHGTEFDADEIFCNFFFGGMPPASRRSSSRIIRLIVRTPERLRIEESVESDYYSVLSQNCRLELQRRQCGFIGETPHCDLLQKFPSAA
ncbi:hypothetical protein HRI_004417200 [Hibiscus trionum]|uniref:J domain-containing protein n=1 Tax=Hibiscus trionum TaxID=183268 RepID=A0A9W7MQ44_HIBTR|nr:hypothetical protein HRI_004417200 [Hibiscus trionum]